jgi:spore coat protein U-like protein
MKNLKTLALAVGAALGFTALNVNAGTATAAFTITARVQANCTSVLASNLTLDYDPVVANAPGGTDLYGSSTLTMRCTPGTVADITMSFSTNTTAGTQRRVQNSGSFLAYTLYVPTGGAPGAACAATVPSTQWKDVNTGTAGTDFLRTTAFANASVQTFNYCVYMPRGQSGPIGNYTDSVTATVNF